MPQQKTVILVAGPTAVGKTGLAIELALHYHTEIISADSRQCYKELSIGVARPSAKELHLVPHHFIGSHSIYDPVTAASFEEFAMEKAAALFQHNNLVVMVGGTGLYLRAFTDGLDPIPAVPPSITEELLQEYNRFGLPWLQQQVAAADPKFYSKAEVQNPHRLLRALAVFRATGASIEAFRQRAPKSRPFQIIPLLLQLPLPRLHQNIAQRVDDMMLQGLEAEVRSLIPFQQLQPLHTVGYKELFQYFNGSSSLSQATEAIKLHTRQYAKRQLTWFRKVPRYIPFSPDDRPVIIQHIDKLLLTAAQH